MDKYMEEAKRQRDMSTCLRRRVGAVIVKDGEIIAKGYNNPTGGIRPCTEIGCIRDKLNIPRGERREICRYICAEQVVITEAARSGKALDGAYIYITSCPCSVCAKMLVSAGIRKIIFLGPYVDKIAEYFIKEAGVMIEII